MFFKSFTITNYWKVFLKTAIITCCLIQLSSITIDYMQGETTSRINLNTPSKTIMPDVSLCFQIMDIINVSLFKKTFSDVEVENLIYSWTWTRAQKAKMYSILGNLTLTELTSYMKNYHLIIRSIVPADLEYGDEKFYNNNITCSQHSYILEPYMCITVQCERNGKPVDYERHAIFAPPYGGRMLTLSLNSELSNFVSTYDIILTTPGSLVRTGSNPSYGYTIRQDSPVTLVLSYSSVVNKLLEKYETDCRDYSKSGFDNRNHFIESCCSNYSYKTFDSAFYGSVQLLDSDNVNMSKHSGYRQYYFEFLDENYSRRLENEKLFKNVRASCWEKASQVDCFTEIYFPKLHRIYRENRKIFNVIIHAPTVPSEINRFFPKYYLMDYLIYIGSSLNFWFGLSLVSLIDEIIARVIIIVQQREGQKLEVRRRSDALKARKNAFLVGNKISHKTRSRWLRPRFIYGPCIISKDYPRMDTDLRRINIDHKNYKFY